MARPAPVSREQNTAASEALEAVRAAGLRIGEAAWRFEKETKDLEWALKATDPDEDHGQNWNWSYADERFAAIWPRWVEARDALRAELETEASSFTEGCVR